MSPETWPRVEELYHSALAREPGRRADFLAEACAGDELLREEVESLLRQNVSADNVLDRPAWDGMAHPLDGPARPQLTAGTQLGPYRIDAPLGAGGMGEVYRAVDTRLDRPVAIKVSARQFSGRFEREARAISALNHPHICTLYDVGPNYLVMELVAGETLAARLRKGPLPMDRVLRYGAEIAGALAAAHSRGVIHRDLKPANIMVTKAGTKVLDFGLAKLGIRGPGTLAAEPTTLTEKGAILGTVQYMSPEQLEGKDADARSDIFSFGAVVYEMASGQKAFPGESQAGVVAAILRSDPPQAVLPPLLNQLLQKCLAKDPDERWQSSQDLATALTWIAEGVASKTQTEISRPVVRWLPWLIAALSTIVALYLLMAGFRRPQPEAPVRLYVPVAGVPGETAPGGRGFALSPDGSRLAYFARSVTRPNLRQLWIRSLDSLTPQALPGTDGARGTPFWSPDSRWLGYHADGKLKKIDLGQPTGSGLVVCDAPRYSGGAWNQDGVIVFAPQADGGLYRVPAAGGTPSPLTALDESRGETSHSYPHFLPDGRHILFGVQAGGASGSIGLVSLDAPAPAKGVRLINADSQAAYAPAPAGEPGDGFLLFRRGETLFAQPFSARSLKTAGDPMPVADNIRSVLDPTSLKGRVAAFSVSSNGILAFEDRAGFMRQLAWFDRSGKILDKPAFAQGTEMSGVQLSPDQTRLALQTYDPLTRRSDIWLFDLARGTPVRFTFEASNYNPLWSSDGSQILFTSGSSGRYGLYRKSSSGTGQAEPLTELAGNKFANDWSRDGRFAAFEWVRDQTGDDIWILPLTGDRKPFPFAETSFREGRAHFSPDGRWLAYQSDETGRSEIYVQPFNPPGEPARLGKVAISTDGGILARWRRDGKELFYRQGRNMMAVDINMPSGQLQPDKPKPLFEAELTGQGGDYYDVTPDGRRFLLITPVDPIQSDITVVLNWTSGLKR